MTCLTHISRLVCSTLLCALTMKTFLRTSGQSNVLQPQVICSSCCLCLEGSVLVLSYSILFLKEAFLDLPVRVKFPIIATCNLGSLLLIALANYDFTQLFESLFDQGLSPLLVLSYV